MKKFNLKGVSTAVWVRIIGGILAVVNLISISVFEFRLLPFADEEIYEIVSTVITGVVLVVNTWKNNSLTKPAQEADQFLSAKKGGK